MSTEANTALLQRLADEVLTGHNLSVLDEVFHADYVEDDPPPGMGPGREGLRQWLAGWITAFPDVRWTIEEQIADEDRVWSRSTWQGTHQGSFLGIPPTGKKVTVAAWTIDRFTGGKIARAPARSLVRLADRAADSCLRWSDWVRRFGTAESAVIAVAVVAFRSRQGFRSASSVAW